MSEISQSSADTNSEKVPPVCESCRFGSGPKRDCDLIIKGELHQLLDQGPCQVDRHMRSRLNVMLRQNFPLVKNQADDVFQETVLHLIDPKLSFPGEKLRGLLGLRRWLPRFLRNQLIDHLRRQKIITRLRCGACENYSRIAPQRCLLEFAPGSGGELVPNPWWGDQVRPSSDPRRLDPPCSEFTWRRPASFDIFDDEVLSETPAASRSAEAGRVCLLAIDRLSVASERGLREAAVLSGHYFSKRTVADLAKTSEVSEKTIKRLLSSGRKALLKIFAEDFGLESPRELLS